MLFPATQPEGNAGAPAAPDVDVAFSPLAMPSLAGPGSIAVVMSAAAQIRSSRPGDWELIYAAVIVGMAATLAFSYLVLRLAGAMVPRVACYPCVRVGRRRRNGQRRAGPTSGLSGRV
jgi:multiple antibiotic resistance protein